MLGAIIQNTPHPLAGLGQILSGVAEGFDKRDRRRGLHPSTTELPLDAAERVTAQLAMAEASKTPIDRAREKIMMQIFGGPQGQGQGQGQGISPPGSPGNLGPTYNMPDTQSGGSPQDALKQLLFPGGQQQNQDFLNSLFNTPQGLYALGIPQRSFEEKPKKPKKPTDDFPVDLYRQGDAGEGFFNLEDPDMINLGSDEYPNFESIDNLPMTKEDRAKLALAIKNDDRDAIKIMLGILKEGVILPGGNR